jgi:hypothetical protein
MSLYKFPPHPQQSTGQMEVVKVLGFGAFP